MNTKIDPERLKRNKPEQKEKPEKKKPEVTAGPLEKITEFAFNPSPDKIREVTVIDRIQGRLLPQLDVINTTWGFVLEIAYFRQNANQYKELYEKDEPDSPNLLNEFIHRTAQWQKSIAGKNLERAIDLSLAEIEAKSADEEGIPGGVDAWKE